MSKVKSPQEKKTASLNRDRRNVYGENAKSSRKNIPLSKQLGHQAARRAANQPLTQLVGNVEEDIAIATEAIVTTRTVELKRKSFRKRPDAPLKAVLERKRTGIWPKR